MLKVKEAKKHASRLRWPDPIAAIAIGMLLSGNSMAQPSQLVLQANFGGVCVGSTAGLYQPFGPLVLDGANDVFGSTFKGPQGVGGIYSGTASGAITALAQFPADGSTSNLWVRGADGNFYGSTSAGTNSTGGIIQMTPAGTTTTLYSFSSLDNNGLNSDGSGVSAITLGSDGNLYGITYRGGANGWGTVFKLSVAGQLTVLSNRTSGDGDAPSSLFQAVDGNFYGTASSGGANGSGTVFMFTPQGAYSVLHTFAAINGSMQNADGAFPTALTDGPGPNVVLYGAASYGGAAGEGNIFEITAGGNFSILHSFSAPDAAGENADGVNPRALVISPQNTLYGATGGGPAGGGVLFNMTLAGSYSVMHAFSASNNVGLNTGGVGPNALIFGTDGFAYGSSSSGGCNGGGTLFKFNALGYTPDDFNSAGMSGVFQFNPSSRQAAVSLMSGQTTVGSVATTIAAGYYPVATGDFNGDGAVDILWTSPKNDLYMWFGKPAESGVTSTYVGTYPPGWTVIGAGDVNGDGKADILWLNASTHQVGYWLMDGTRQIGSYTTTYAAGYYPVATGDFNGDGLVDIVWTSAKNDLYIWMGNARTASGFTTNYVATYPAGWSIVGTGDFNGDGKDDLVWMNSANTEWGVWLMDGASVTSMLEASTSPGRSIATVGDFTGNGLADILWKNGNNLELWTTSNSLNVDGMPQINFSVTTLSGLNAGLPVFNSRMPVHAPSP